VNLQTNDATASHTIPQIGARDVVDPCPDPVAFALDAELVPLTIFERLAGSRIGPCAGEHESATSLVINASGGTCLLGGNFHLITVDTIRRYYPFPRRGVTPAEYEHLLLFGDLAAYLHA